MRLQLSCLVSSKTIYPRGLLTYPSPLRAGQGLYVYLFLFWSGTGEWEVGSKIFLVNRLLLNIALVSIIDIKSLLDPDIIEILILVSS